MAIVPLDKTVFQLPDGVGIVRFHDGDLLSWSQLLGDGVQEWSVFERRWTVILIQNGNFDLQKKSALMTVFRNFTNYIFNEVSNCFRGKYVLY